MKVFTLLALCFFVLLSSCGADYIVDQKKKFENNQWAYSDSLSCSIDISDTKKLYSLYLDVEHLTEYAYRNMYIRLHSIFPDGKRVTERISLELMNKIGQWQGDCSADECDFRLPINEGTHFGQTGKHTFVVEQFMRENPLAGVQSMAFRIEDTGQVRKEGAREK
ncbi:MAG: gliding motility lipoprotein GldH [Bacteroidota bacterium]